MIDFGKLSEPFPALDVEWRVQSCGEKDGRFWAIVIPYIQNRAIMDRLDAVCGPASWRNEYTKGPEGGILCGLSIKNDGEWVTKWDGAANTEVKEGGKLDDDTNIKGGLSASMKRAGVQWGIGRYLYNLEASFADIGEGGRYRGKTKEGKAFKWNPPTLPAWALPKGSPDPANEFVTLKGTLMDWLAVNPPVFNAAQAEYAEKAISEKNIVNMKAAIAKAVEKSKAKKE